MRLLPLMLFLTSLTASPLLLADFSPQEWQSRVATQKNIDQLGHLYIEFLLEEDPSMSATLGVHGKGDDASYYDRRLPDVSAGRIALNNAARAFLLEYLAQIDESTLSRADQIDLHILTQRVALDQLRMDQLRELTNPMGWTTTLGGAMAGLVLRDYAPLDQRLQSFGARCSATPLLLDQVQALLQPETVKRIVVRHSNPR